MKRAIIYAGLMVFAMCHTILFALLGPATREMGFAEWQVGAIISTSAVGFVAISALWGRIADRWGRRNTIVTGLLGYSLSTFLFAWLVLYGVSYPDKHTANLGVDAVINLFSAPTRRIIALVAGAICIGYAFLVFKGAWDYWANFANLPQPTGRWFPTGFEEMLKWIETLMNVGEAYEKFPIFMLYFILTFVLWLLLFRFIQATVRVWTGKSQTLIVSHEAEEAIEDVKHMNAGD